MAEPVFKLLRCDAEASHMLGWAKKEVRRLVDFAKLDAFNRTWKFGDVSVRAQYFGGVARLWLEAEATERMAVWATIGVPPTGGLRTAQYAYGWKNYIYRQAITFSIWRDNGAVLYDAIWGDYTDANPASSPYVFAAPISSTLERHPYVVLPGALSNYGAQHLSFSGTSYNTYYYEPVAMVRDGDGATGVRKFNIQKIESARSYSSRPNSVVTLGASDYVSVSGVGETELAGEIIRLTSDIQTAFTDAWNLSERVTTDSHVLDASGNIAYSFSGGVVCSKAYGGPGTPFTYEATYTDVPYLSVYENLTILDGYARYNPMMAYITPTAGPAPAIQPGQTLVFSGTDSGSFLDGVWTFNSAFQWGVIPAYVPPESEAEIPADQVPLPGWVGQLQSGVIPATVEAALRSKVPKSDYTYKTAELTAEYVSLTPRVVRMSYTWSDEDGNEHEEIEVISGSKITNGPVGGVGGVVPRYDLDVYSVYSEHDETFSSYAMLFGGFSRPYDTASRAYIVTAVDTIPPLVGGVRVVSGASAEQVVVATGAYSGGVSSTYNIEYDIASYTVLGSVFPARIYSGDVNDLNLNLSGFSLAVPPITQQFLVSFPAKNNKKASEAPGVYKYLGFYMEPGMYVDVVPLRLTASTATTYTYEVRYVAKCKYGAGDVFSAEPARSVGTTITVPRPDNEEEDEQLGSVKTLLVYGGIKWDDVKEEARAQRKALADPNDPAHDPLMKAVLDALTPQE